jgi:hypothetical protein
VDLEIRAMGLAAMPFLLAMAGDPALTEVDRESVTAADAVRSSFTSRDKAAPEGILATMDRPATRGEVAGRILLEIAPTSVTGSQWHRKSNEDLLSACAEFAAKYRGASDEQLAVVYLGGDNSRLQSAAMAFLLRAARVRRIPPFEEYLVSPIVRDPEGYDYEVELSTATQRARSLAVYAASRGEEVRPVVDRFLALAEKTADDYRKPANVNYGSAEKDQKHEQETQRRIRDIAKGLSEIGYGRSPSELIAAILEETVKAEPAARGVHRETLIALLQAMPAGDALGLLLSTALGASPKGRVTVAGLARSTFCGDPGDCTTAHDATGLKPAEHAAAWRQLVKTARDETEDSATDAFLCLNEDLFAPPMLASRAGMIFSNHEGEAQIKEPAGTRARELI